MKLPGSVRRNRPTELKAETERLSQALLETSIEIQAMKKKNRLG
jgi:hypothetical protein